ncbi:anthrax toxin receptor-like isoform X1 [Talpa occidentalis]|uniref:anthrax toxin receptor-like isoform X1 n=1 Tax=Talpa occidentalis TaxID=50954 RepID=UPI00188FF0A7|nr:anthrax toxin receptor-like isoform X1 [Talpa occidentalis]
MGQGDTLAGSGASTQNQSYSVARAEISVPCSLRAAQKMGSSWPGMPRVAFFLLLVLPPLLASSGAYQHRAPTWLDFHYFSRARRNLPSNTNLDGESTRQGHSQDTGSRERLADHKKSCQSNLDLYLILDKSGSVDTNWIFTYGFVEDFLKIFENPNMRVSIITFSTRGHTVLKLTSDKKEIEEGLNQLRNTVPTGDTNMQEGFKAVNEQISTANSGEEKVHSMVVSLIDGTLWPESFEATKYEAQKTRQLGGTVYTVGVNNYMKNQLLAIADSEKHVVGVDTGFYDLKNVVDSLAAKSCIELTSVAPPIHCVGDKKAAQVEDTSIKCSGVKIEVPANEISVEVSLNNGASFISNGLKISSKDCGDHRTSQRTHISPSGVPPTHSSSVIRPMRKALRRNSGQIPGLQPPFVLNVGTPGSTNQGSQFPDINPYHLATLLLIILMPVLIGCWWRLRSSRNKEPEQTCVPTCPPTVVVPSGADGNLKQLENKLDMLGMQIMGNFFQKRNRCPRMWCQPRRKTCSLFRSPRGKMPGPACFPFNCSWSRCPYAPCPPPQLSCSQPPQFACSIGPPGYSQ